MNKILLLLLLVPTIIMAQNPFKFTKVEYIGSMDKEDWTKGWANWDPQKTVYPSVTESTTLNAVASNGVINISSDITLDPSRTYLLTGLVYINDGATLTIPPGTIIRAEGNSLSTPANWATIVVQKGGKINAIGTKTNPIVFTSNKEAGLRREGDWGGLVILGKAMNNQQGVTSACQECIKGESLIEGPFGYPNGSHGGSDNSDNSGRIEFVRIEFPGLVLSANNEINGLTLGSVGYGTTINHIQVSFSNDDSYEWFGGTVNSRYLIAFRGTDDDFDTDYGYSGMNQFGIGFKDSINYDKTWNSTSGGSTSEGFESDNDAAGSINKPITSAIFSNYTMIGPYAEGDISHSVVVKGAYRRGVRIRRNSSQSIYNSIFMGYRNVIMIDGSLSEGNGNITNPSSRCDSMEFRNNILMYTNRISPTSTGLVEVSNGRDTAVVSKWIYGSSNKVNPTSPLLIDPNNYTSPNFIPKTSTIGAEFSCKMQIASLSTIYPKETISIYPNPTNDYINIGLSGIYDVSISSMDGFEIKRVSTDGKIKINIKDINSGIYLVRISKGKEHSTIRLMVK